MRIPRIIHQTWVGPDPKPEHWMKTWKEKNPEWDYMLWDNDNVKDLNIVCKKQFEYYWDNGIWHGIGDIVRYHALYRYGGFQAAGDSICLYPIDELFNNDSEIFTVLCDGKPQDWGREDGIEDGIIPPFLTKGNKTFDGLVAPIHASTKGHWFIKKLIEEIENREILEVPLSLLKYQPFISTGNKFCQEMIKKYQPEIVLFPRHYFFPTRFEARIKTPRVYKYKGNDRVYSEHFSYTTKKIF